jgi:ABC-type lipoprotein release transport system permease subunit
MAAVLYRARWLLRRGWRAGLAFALVAGAVAGAAGAAWAAGRRGTDAYHRFVAHVDEPAYGAFFCPPGTGIDELGSYPRCESPYDPAEEMSFLRGLPGVTAVARATFVPIEITVAGQSFQAAISVTFDGSIVSASGDPLVVRGRLPSAPDELFASEAAAGAFPLGTEVVIRPLSVDTGEPLDLPPQTLRLVGVGRFPVDLAAKENGLGQVSGTAFVAPSWWTQWGSRIQSSGAGVLARLTSGVTEESIRAAVAERWPGRVVYDIPGRDSKQETVSDAIGYESNTLSALGVMVGLAGLVFVGQALARQARREQSDLEALSALGFRRGQAAASAALRAVPTALLAATVAVGVVWISSHWTPIGLAALAEPDPGLRIDPLASAAAALATAFVVVIAMTLPALPGHTRTTSGGVAGRLVGATRLPPAGIAGVGMVSGRRARGVAVTTALAGVGVATCVGVAAATVAASFQRVLDSPAAYGARWDATVSTNVEGLQLVPQLAAAHDVAEAGAVFRNDGLVDGRPYPIVAVRGLGGTAAAAWTTIVAGRQPERDGEVALGATTMRELHVGVGDVVKVKVATHAPTDQLTVVGRAVFNDGSELEAGIGALVTDTYYTASTGAIDPSQLELRLRPGADPQAAFAPFAQVGANVFPPTPPATVRNIARVRWLPWVLALLVGVLAVGALTHALITSVRAHRRELAVLRSLGFTPRQTATAVWWESLAIAVAGILIGVPAGMVVGRWGWRLLADQIGIPPQPATPWLWTTVAVALIVMLAFAVAVWPGRRAANVPPGLALRAE